MERLAEVTQRVRADLAQADVTIALAGDAALALVFDARQLELFAQNLRQVFEADVDLEHVLAGAAAGFALPALLIARLTERIPRLALTLRNAATLLVGEAKARNVDLRDRDGDELFALFAEQLALGDKAPQVLPDFAANDLLEARVVLVNPQGHAWMLTGAR